MLEIATALMLVAAFALIAFPTWRAVERSAQDRNARSTLLSLEPEVARAVLEAGEVPTNLEDRMRVSDLSMVGSASPSTSSDVVSVGGLSGSTDRAVLTVLSKTGACWVMSTVIDDDPRWGVDRSPGTAACRASHPGISAATVTGSEKEPSSLTLPGS